MNAARAAMLIEGLSLVRADPALARKAEWCIAYVESEMAEALARLSR